MKRYEYCRDVPAKTQWTAQQGILLRSDDRLKDSVVSRASLQKILLSPEENVGLEKQFENTQMELWKNLFRQCETVDVVVRLPDMLFDCLLPQSDAEFTCIAEMFQCGEQTLRQEAERLTMCHRLCCCDEYQFDAQYLRLFELQINSIFRGAEHSGRTQLSMLLPHTGNVREISLLCSLVDSIAAEYNVCCLLGIEIPTPKAALCMREYLGLTNFFVFDTEALTHNLYGVSDGEAADAVAYYMRVGLFDQSPFCSFDQTGLGTLLLLAIGQVRAADHRIGIGLMGKPACEPVGLSFCKENAVEMLFEGKDLE